MIYKLHNIKKLKLQKTKAKGSRNSTIFLLHSNGPSHLCICPSSETTGCH